VISVVSIVAVPSIVGSLRQRPVSFTTESQLS